MYYFLILLSIVIFCMGFSHNVYQPIVLRLLQGVITGYSTACITLIATQTERKHVGFALGTLSTASISGSLIGPTIGGYLEEILELQSVFFVTGTLMMIVFITTAIFVKENFVPSKKRVLNIKEVWNVIPNHNLIVIMFVTSFILQLAFYSIEPIVTVYVTELAHSSLHVALISGLTFSASGLASIIAAPKLGKLSDRIGARKVILMALIAAGIVSIPQAFVKNPWQLMLLRFILGLATAGLTPSVNVIVRKVSPEHLIGRIFGFSISAQYLGTFSGSILGGQIAAMFGIRSVFIVTGSLLLTNAFWVYKAAYRKLKAFV
ncbi:Predicted permease [Clostridium kluyveri DSM 555]|uniref:Predicted permease n=2 Tax=Clostridium kluyveri TaxID=1534 RepID=A5N303_CLOK5|nr:Predicted permease [Clostridium kluyveri DSM 555]